ncbi:hypothetical protein EUX98_g4093 [Antrodiella citrinella]|uniref:SnoaL-like domain-containing protein n=1 Tax=Antrodiella citrinella TaxID=2447956 RepID=A0A4S4MUU9_9APHY|nr:hypothetical protein EUX98_g4093 [Antrodiella citrinella]
MPISPSSVLPATRSAQLQATLAWIEAVSSADFAAMQDAVTEDYTQELLPADSQHPPWPSRAAYLEFYSKLLPNFASFVTTIHEVKECKGLVLMDASSVADTITGFHYEMAYDLTFTVAQQTDGSYKVTSLKEHFRDTAARDALEKHFILQVQAPQAGWAGAFGN